jgi:hypothetical protein
MSAKQPTPLQDPARLGNAKPIKFPAHIEAMIDEAGVKLGLEKQEVVRLGTWIGLHAISEIKFDVGGLIARTALKNWEHMRELREIPGRVRAEDETTVTVPVPAAKASDEKKRRKA